MSDKNDVVMVNLDRPRMLWFGHKAMKTLGAMTGKNMQQVLESMSNMDFEDVEQLYFCGLQKDAKLNNEVLKMEDMEDLIDHIPFMKVSTYIQRAFGLAVAGDNEEEVSGVVTKNAVRVPLKK